MWSAKAIAAGICPGRSFSAGPTCCPHRQLVYDQDGNLATDSRYEAYKDYDGVKFPSQIEIWRPQEEYDITLTIVKLQLNEPLADDKFALEQPDGRAGGASGSAAVQPGECDGWEVSSSAISNWQLAKTIWYSSVRKRRSSCPGQLLNRELPIANCC